MGVIRHTSEGNGNWILWFGLDTVAKVIVIVFGWRLSVLELCVSVGVCKCVGVFLLFTLKMRWWGKNYYCYFANLLEVQFYSYPTAIPNDKSLTWTFSVSKNSKDDVISSCRTWWTMHNRYVYRFWKLVCFSLSIIIIIIIMEKKSFIFHRHSVSILSFGEKLNGLLNRGVFTICLNFVWLFVVVVSCWFVD